MTQKSSKQLLGGALMGGLMDGLINALMNGLMDALMDALMQLSDECLSFDCLADRLLLDERLQAAQLKT